MKFYHFFAIFAMFFATQASAKVTIGTAEKIKKVAELPDVEDYKLDDGQVNAGYMDLGILYKQFEVAGMPYWVSEEPVFIGTTAREDAYVMLTPEEADEIIKANKLDKEALIQLGFWDKHWGILVSLAVFGAIFLYYFFKKEPENNDIITDEQPNNTH